MANPESYRGSAVGLCRLAEASASGVDKPTTSR